MPIRKYRRRRVYRKKRRVRRTRRVPRPLGRSQRFLRTSYLGTIAPGASAPTYDAYDFKLSDLPDYTEFTNLFDEYYIYKISLMFIPMRTQLNTNPASTVPWFIYAVDKDDSAPVTSYDALLQYPAVKITQMTKKVYVTFRPRFSSVVYNTAVTSGYGSRTGWLDCSNASIPHFGFKYGIDSATLNQYQYVVWCKYTILCRGVR